MGNATWPELLWTGFGILCVSQVGYYWWATVQDYRYAQREEQSGGELDKEKLFAARVLSQTAGGLLIAQCFFLIAGILACFLPTRNATTSTSSMDGWVTVIILLLILGQATLGLISVHLNRSYWAQVNRLVELRKRLQVSQPVSDIL